MMNQISNCGRSLELLCEMRRLAIWIMAITCLVDLSSCGTTSFTPPPVTVELVRNGSDPHRDIAILSEGRALFVHRCIECHTLPSIQRRAAVDPASARPLRHWRQVHLRQRYRPEQWTKNCLRECNGDRSGPFEAAAR